jgi:hypothetical protein
MFYRVGDRTEPWGTSSCISLGVDISPSTEILNLRCVTKKLVSLIKLVEKSNLDYLNSKPACHVVSNAFLMFKNTASIEIRRCIRKWIQFKDINFSSTDGEQMQMLIFEIVLLHNAALLVSINDLLRPFEREAFRLLTKPRLHRLLDVNMPADLVTVQCLLWDRRCGNRTALHRDCKGEAEAIQIQAIAQSVPLLLPYAAELCRGATAPLWTVVRVVCDELHVKLVLQQSRILGTLHSFTMWL